MKSSARFGSALLTVLAVAACGTDVAHNKDYGSPPQPLEFDPGKGPTAGDGYGSGNGADNIGTTLDYVCPDELRRCPATFTFPYSGEKNVELRGNFRDGAWETGVPMTREGSLWTVTTPVPPGKPVEHKFFADGKWLPEGPNAVAEPTVCGEEFVCDEPPLPPAGVYDWRDAVIYFVFVDRFANGNTANDCHVPGADDGGNYKGGDWAGVTRKINEGYFNDLGVNTLWLTVPMQNANDFAGAGVGGDTHRYSAYHGYWPKDLNSPESCFGTMQELKDLVAAAHGKKLKILFDYAMVHVHIGSTIYDQHKDWFHENKNGGNNCICGQGCDWDRDGSRCWFTDYLPHWDYTKAAARSYSTDNAVKWIKDTGADGYRLDAIKHVDQSWLLDLRTKIKAQITATQSPPQRFYMVGETYDFENKALLKSFVDPQTKLDGQFDFPLRKRIVESVVMRRYTGMKDLAAFMDQNENAYGSTAIMSTFIGNHDLPRVVHQAEDNPVWGGQGDDGKNRAWENRPPLPSGRAPFERLANGFAVLMTNKGAPLVYYGDEVGLPGAGDPDNRRMMTFDGQWNEDQRFLRDRLAKLNAIRAAHPALRRGRRQTLGRPTDNLWVYSMTVSDRAARETVYVAVNRSDSAQSTNALPAGELQELVTGTGARGPDAQIPPRQTRIWIAR